MQVFHVKEIPLELYEVLFDIKHIQKFTFKKKGVLLNFSKFLPGALTSGLWA